MFCPNCGTQNDSAATPCKKCGFKLSGVSVPKFKGTMVLNSDQTVQELIEEHRRRQPPAGTSNEARRASEPPPPSSASTRPPSSFPGTRGPVLQPPRAAPGARRRMGGTMLGVAPQAGGLLPPEFTARPAPTAPLEPPRHEPEPSRDETASLSEPSAASATDPYAGTAAMPAVEPSPSPSPPPAAAEPADSTEGVEDAEQLAANGTGDDAVPARPARAIAATAPLPQQPDAIASRRDSQQPGPPNLRPLDIALIILTLGLYGIVLWAKQRKPAA